MDFTARRYASAVYAVLVSFCLSVCLSVIRRSSTNMAKPIGSHKQRFTIAQELQFSDAKNLGEIATGSSLTGAKKGEVGYNRRFRPISRYISETVHDRDISTMER